MFILIELLVKFTFLIVIFCNIYTVDSEELLNKYHTMSDLSDTVDQNIVCISLQKDHDHISDIFTLNVF